MVTRPLNEAPERTHDALLMHLKRHGEMTVADLCAALGITSMAVRRHLVGLQNEGLVGSRMVRQSRGRPTYRYHLTDKAEELFPSGFEKLATDLLETVFEMGGHKGVMDLLSLRNERTARKLEARLAGKSAREKVVELARFFSEGGYMTEWEELPDGKFLIYQRHCAVHELASRFRQLCVLEPRLIGRVLGARVTRRKYMLKDDPVCAYLVEGL